MRTHIAIASLALAATWHAPAMADGACAIPGYLVQSIQAQLYTVDHSGLGGLFSPNRMWSAVVDRQGRLCSVVVDGDAWPGSRAIAIAKASTANDFSNSALALSTANLYSAVQPGGSLYGLNESNPFNPAFLPQGSGIGQVPGGVITFGGGVALYLNRQVIGGLGVSGDTSCTDHAIAYAMRRNVHLDGVPDGVNNHTDDIIFLKPGEAPNGFKHPTC